MNGVFHDGLSFIVNDEPSLSPPPRPARSAVPDPDETFVYHTWLDSQFVQADIKSGVGIRVSCPAADMSTATRLRWPKTTGYVKTSRRNGIFFHRIVKKMVFT